MAIDAYFLPNVTTGLSLRLAQPCFGSTIAIRRETLSAIGGLRAYANQLADDYAIGMAVRKLGLQVAVPGFTVGHVCGECGFTALWQQELRWARTVRTVDPVGYAGSVIAHPFALALMGAALENSHGLSLLVLALASRFAVCVSTELRFDLPSHPYWLIPLRDILNFAVFVSSFAGRDVHWRSHDYSVAPDGAMRIEEAIR